MTKGVVLIAINNVNFDYIKMAEVNANLIRKHMQVPVTLITDHDGSYHPILKETDVFDRVIVNTPNAVVNPRVFHDTVYHKVIDDFKNSNRTSVFELTPYDETLLLDVDYLILNDVLNNVWGSVEDVMINRDATSLLFNPLQGREYRLNDFGIRMLWATAVYFKKDSERAKLLFDMVNHVRETWEFYQLAYNFPNMMFRNDYAFAIAAHTIDGFVETDNIPALPDPVIYTATDRDQLYRIDEKGLLFFANDPEQDWKFYPVRVTGINVHCMNKISILRNLDNFKVLYGDN
jgi:hypothetical protein